MRIIQHKESQKWNELKKVAQKVDQSHLPFRMWRIDLVVETLHKEATPSFIAAFSVKGALEVFSVFSIASDTIHEI